MIQCEKGRVHIHGDPTDVLAELMTIIHIMVTDMGYPLAKIYECIDKYVAVE